MYDYRLDDGGISRTGKSEDEEEETKKSYKVTNSCTLIRFDFSCLYSIHIN